MMHFSDWVSCESILCVCESVGMCACHQGQKNIHVLRLIKQRQWVQISKWESLITSERHECSHHSSVD